MKIFFVSLALAGGLLAQAPFQVKVTGHGQPIILIPGLSSSGETWDTTVTHYQDRFECHVLTVAGFAGVPRVPAPMLDRVRDGLADYIRQKKLDHPIIAGHSLGGFLALALAAKYPDLPGRLVIVDAYPFLPGMMDPAATLASTQANATQMRQSMSAQSQDDYQRFVKSGVATRAMVTADANLDRIIGWGLNSDRTAVTDAMYEMFTSDLRDDIARIKSPTLVMLTWAGYGQYTDHQKTEANGRRQYAKLAKVQIEVTDTARHFIMWDDPEWMFARMDAFLGMTTTVSAQ